MILLSQASFIVLVLPLAIAQGWSLKKPVLRLNADKSPNALMPSRKFTKIKPLASSPPSRSPFFQSAQQKGKGLLQKLESVHDTRNSEADDKKVDMSTYEFTLSPGYEEPPKTGLDHELPKDRKFIKVDVKGKPREDRLQSGCAPYTFYVDVQNGILIFDWSYRTFDRAEPENQRKLSDIIHEAVKRVWAKVQSKEASKETMKGDCLKYIIRADIDPHETKAILSESATRRKNRNGINIYESGTPEFQAFFGTTHGKTPLWRMIDYSCALGRPVPSRVLVSMEKTVDALIVCERYRAA